jgi:hypothetical protein
MPAKEGRREMLRKTKVQEKLANENFSYHAADPDVGGGARIQRDGLARDLQHALRSRRGKILSPLV